MAVPDYLVDKVEGKETIFFTSCTALSLEIYCAFSKSKDMAAHDLTLVKVFWVSLPLGSAPA
jgi:hypothetical protein